MYPIFSLYTENDVAYKVMFTYTFDILLFFIVAEPTQFDIEFRNPLQISLSISSVALICELSSRTDEVKSGKSLSIFSNLSSF